MKIIFENGYLKGKYAQSYIDKKNKLRSNRKLEDVKSVMFLALGSFVGLSQVAEYTMTSIINITRVYRKNVDDDKLKSLFQIALNKFDIDDYELDKANTLGPVLNDLKQLNLITEEQYLDCRFLVDNRNDFIHNYFMNRPRILVDVKQMKILILQLFYSTLGLNQLINMVFEKFELEVIQKHPSLVEYLNDFNEMFIGEFKG